MARLRWIISPGNSRPLIAILRLRLRAFHRRWHVLRTETNLPYAVLLLILCLALTVIWRVARPDYLPELWPEMAGMTLDVFFILIVFALFERRRTRTLFVARQEETIDDYKRWDDPEAQRRIAGAVRRLNRAFVHAVDFAGIRLTDFYFVEHGIHRIAGSRFCVDPAAEEWENSAALTYVRFDHLDCRGVVFSLPRIRKYDTYIRPVELTDCSFEHCNLRGACFDGARLSWPEAPPNSHYVGRVISGEDVDFEQETFGPFYRADLSDASFRGCSFLNADFRDAEGLESADFFRANGLDEAAFDDGHIRWLVLKNAARRE